LNKNIKISVIITSYNDWKYLKRIFNDLKDQSVNKSQFEVLVLEAGLLYSSEINKYLKTKSNNIKLWFVDRLSRTKSLNFLVEKSKANLIIRLDARSHISRSYISDIYKLSKKYNVANVGGVLIPIGEEKNQKIIASIMQHPLSFGGANFRNSNFNGLVETLYLGAFNKKLMPSRPWFDEINPKISEDSDLNFRIRKNGGSIFLDSSIRVEYFAREDFKSFFKLCFNYGFARGTFVQKYKTFLAYRQLVPPFCFLTSLGLFIFGFFNPLLHLLLVSLFAGYIALLTVFSFKISTTDKSFFKYLVGFFGCHFFWVLGFFMSFVKFKRLK
jgi:succinoglycan biosynthesis protein ExoA